MKPVPDLLIIDLVLSGVDGFTVINQLGPTSPAVVAMSGSEEALRQLNSPHVVRAMKKPFDDTRLAEVVSFVLDKASAQEIRP